MDTSNWTVEDHIDWMKSHGAQIRYLNEVKLNVMLTTWERSMGFEKSVHSLDLMTTTDKYRKMGVIQ